MGPNIIADLGYLAEEGIVYKLQSWHLAENSQGKSAGGRLGLACKPAKGCEQGRFTKGAGPAVLG